jgi:hypothetical protein
LHPEDSSQRQTAAAPGFAPDTFGSSGPSRGSTAAPPHDHGHPPPFRPSASAHRRRPVSPGRLDTPDLGDVMPPPPLASRRAVEPPEGTHSARVLPPFAPWRSGLSSPAGEPAAQKRVSSRVAAFEAPVSFPSAGTRDDTAEPEDLDGEPAAPPPFLPLADGSELPAFLGDLGPPLVPS